MRAVSPLTLAFINGCLLNKAIVIDVGPLAQEKTQNLYMALEYRLEEGRNPNVCLAVNIGPRLNQTTDLRKIPNLARRNQLLTDLTCVAHDSPSIVENHLCKGGMAHNVLRMAEVAARRETRREFSQSVQPLGCGVVRLGLGHSVLCAVPSRGELGLQGRQAWGTQFYYWDQENVK